MTVARTYFFNRTSSEELADLCGRREDFFLENVDELNPALARIQALLGANGLSSAVEHAPLNPSTGLGDLLSAAVPAIGLMSGLVQAAGWAMRPASDVTLRVTSETSVSVAFARGGD